MASSAPTPLWKLVVTAQRGGRDLFETLRDGGVNEQEAREFAEQLRDANEPLYKPDSETPEEAYQRQLAYSELPPEYADCTFESFKQLSERARRGKMLAFWTCRLFVKANGRSFTLTSAYKRLHLELPEDPPARHSVVLYGAMGVGKTGLAVAAAHQLMAQGRHVVYTRAQDIIADVWDTYRRKDQIGYKGRTRAQIIDALRAVPFLIIDEMGGEHDGSRDRRDIMEDILRPRCQQKRPTLITTNHTPRTFEAEWGGKTTDKLLERAHWIPMGGEPLRDKRQPDPGIVI